jgi:hypothetical protein
MTTLGEGESGHFWPRFLPDGRRYMYLAYSGQAANRAIYAGSLDSPPESKDRTKVVAADQCVVLASPSGRNRYLVFYREGALFAQPFNPKTLAVSGEEAAWPAT